MNNSIQLTGENAGLASQQSTLVAQINQVMSVLNHIMDQAEAIPDNASFGEKTREILMPYTIMRNIAKKQITDLTNESILNTEGSTTV